jgi:hypothetical protein
MEIGKERMEKGPAEPAKRTRQEGVFPQTLPGRKMRVARQKDGGLRMTVHHPRTHGYCEGRTEIRGLMRPLGAGGEGDHDTAETGDCV